MKRRDFIKWSALSALPVLAAGSYRSSLESAEPPEQPGFFRLSKKQGRWWLIDPKGEKYFSIGLNHIDPASLRYPENIHIWRDKYGNSMERWLKESVAPNLTDWGFNCVGWNQEVVTRDVLNHRHSRHFSYEEYQWLDMPYCHQLPFADFHQWEAEVRNPDFFSPGFANWCDHVAREHCVPLANDPKLIGYFYIDCPCWIHVRPINQWKGPIFDPKKLETDKGRRELERIARQYYRVMHDAIRRYDRNHLILGDRYEANAAMSMSVIEGARDFVDVLSFQDFKDPVGHMDEWHRKTGMPVLWADGSKSVKIPGTRQLRVDGNWWGEQLAGLRKNQGCVGAHLCGAYLRNRVRRKGLLSEDDEPDTEMVNLVRKANLETAQWVRRS
jgi:hypothetical protein